MIYKTVDTVLVNVRLYKYMVAAQQYGKIDSWTYEKTHQNKL